MYFTQRPWTILEPESHSQLMQSACQLYASGELEQAEEACWQCLGHDAGNSQAHNLLGNIGIKTGNPKLSRELFHTALTLEEQNVVYSANLAASDLALGAYEEAEETLRQMVEQEVAEPEPFINLAALYMDQGRLKEATSVLDKSTQIRPHAAAFALLAWLFIQYGLKEQACEFMRAGYNLSPEGQTISLLNEVCAFIDKHEIPDPDNQSEEETISLF